MQRNRALATRRLVPAILAVCMLAAACGSGPSSTTAGVTVTDSAGIELVDNSVASRPEASPIPIHEEMRIGSVDGPEEEQLYLVRRIEVGPADTLYVPLLRANEIRVFSPDGEYMRTLGRAGEGPGEFQGLSTIFLAGDTVVAFDADLARVVLMARDGRVLETWPVRTPNIFLVPVDRVPGGWLVRPPGESQFPDPGRTIQRTSRLAVASSVTAAVEALRRGEDGAAEMREIVEYPVGRRVGMLMGEARTAQSPLWEPAASWAVDARGQIYVTATGEYRIDVYDLQGDLVRRLRRSHEPVPITDDLKRRFVAEVTAHYDTVEVRTEFGTDPVDRYRFQADVPTREHLPPLGTIHASSDGHLLVRRPDLVDDPVALEWTRLGPQASYWDLFDPDGVFLGTVQFPPRFRPDAVGRDWVVGVIRDELGVEYVVRYGLELDASG